MVYVDHFDENEGEDDAAGGDNEGKVSGGSDGDGMYFGRW